jgi:hypothetical protein
LKEKIVGWTETRSSIPQSSVLGQELFSIFKNDVHSMLETLEQIKDNNNIGGTYSGDKGGETRCNR